jgi:hypothetical protein
MADWGMKATIDTKSVTSTEPRDYAFNSQYAIVKIFMEGSGSVTVANSSTQTVTIDHNLNFIPIALGYCENVPSSGNYYIGSYLSVNPITTLNSGISSYDSYVTTTQLILKFYNNSGGSRTMQYKYYIFADNGA